MLELYLCENMGEINKMVTTILIIIAFILGAIAGIIYGMKAVSLYFKGIKNRAEKLGYIKTDSKGNVIEIDKNLKYIPYEKSTKGDK